MANMIDRNRLQQFLSLDFYARQLVEGFITGLHKSPFHGFSVEFAEHKSYNPGESTRHIDWKLYAKTEKLYVKQYEEETNLRCHLVIDHSSSMYFPLIKHPDIDHPNKITFATYAAAAILQLMRKQRDAAGMSFFSNTIEFKTPTRSSDTHFEYLMTELEKLLVLLKKGEQRGTSAVDALHQIAEQIHKRSLVVIFSDMFDNLEDPELLFSALQHLRHNKHEVILFHVVDRQKELDFDFDQRPYRFVDLETGEKLKLLPDEVRDKYRQQLYEYKEQLKLRCARFKVDFIEADIHQGFDQVLLPYFLKRSRLY